MVTVDLITGFLGAGKTTFIHKYLHHLQEMDLKVQIIENEFGDVSVDKDLLQDEDCDILDLSGLCMCCVGKDAFIQMLKESARSGCDRIIVEPSGIYDVDEFFEVLSLPEINELCEIGSIITIADPLEIDYASDESRYLMFGQFLAAGTIVLSKTDIVSTDKIQAAIESIDEIMKENGCDNGVMAEVVIKPIDELTQDDFDDIMDSGFFRVVHDREELVHSEIFQSANFKVEVQNKETIINVVNRIFESPSCGFVYRIKGYAYDKEQSCYEVNCTSEVCSVKKLDCKKEQNLEGRLVIIGQHLREEEIKNIIKN